MRYREHLLFVICTLLSGAAIAAASEPGPAVQFNDRGELRRPLDYSQWVFLNSALGLTYGPNRSRAGQAPRFSNVFVNPEAYRIFMQTGKWPNGTFFLLEVRESRQPASATDGSVSQGSRIALEGAVRDATRFPADGWAYFSFSEGGELLGTAAPHGRDASCYDCHERHGAVQWTFTQFYADAFARAVQLGTVRRKYDPSRKISEKGH